MKDSRLAPRRVGPRGGQQASPERGGRPAARLSLGELLTGIDIGVNGFSPCSAARGSVTCTTGEGESVTGGKLSRISLAIAAATSLTVMSMDRENGWGDGEMKKTGRKMRDGVSVDGDGDSGRRREVSKQGCEKTGLLFKASL